MSNEQPIEAVLSKLKGVKKTGADQWEARCPAHEDKKPSLSIGIGREGQVLLKCHAGCELQAITNALGIEVRDLFVKKPRARGKEPVIYNYYDEKAVLLYQVVRQPGKDFKQRQPKPGTTDEWIWKITDPPVRRVLYCLPEVLAASPDEWIFVCEGEKSVNSIRSLGLIATTNSGGAGKWRIEHAESLKDRKVCILPDNDPVGREHAETVAETLPNATILELPGNTSEGADPTDWVGRGGNKEELLELLSSAAEPEIPNQEMPEGILGWEVWSAEKAFEPRAPLQYVVEGLFTLPSLNVVYGQPGGKKSLLMTDMAVCVAGGIPWLERLPGEPGRGFRTIQVPVLLLDFDNGSRRMHERVEACIRGHGLDPAQLPLYYVSMPSPWLDAGDGNAIDDLICLACEKNVGFIVTDNLGTISGGKDENTAEMITVLTNLRRLSEETGAATNIIHHERKQSKNTASARRGESLRGFSGIEAALDAAVQVCLGEDKNEITLYMTKTRDYVRPIIGALFSFDHKEESTELKWAKLWGREIDYDTREDKTKKAILKALGGRTLNTKDLTAATKEMVPDVGVNQIRNMIREQTATGELVVAPGGKNNEQLYTAAE